MLLTLPGSAQVYARRIYNSCMEMESGRIVAEIGAGGWINVHKFKEGFKTS